jgi:hypothetical protein
VDGCEVVDAIARSPLRSLLGSWEGREAEGRQTFGAPGAASALSNHMLQVRVQWLLPPQVGGREEISLEVLLQPVRVSLGPDALEFFETFASTFSSSTSAFEVPPGAPLPPFLHRFRVSPVHVKLDYTPGPVRFSRLLQGDVLQILNLVPIDGMRLLLPGIDRWGVAGDVATLGSLVASVWGSSVSQSQVHRCLAGVASPLVPLRSVANVGSAMVRVLHVPRGPRSTVHGHVSGRVGVGVAQGIAACMQAVVVESLRVVQGAASSTRGSLTFVRGLLVDDTEGCPRSGRFVGRPPVSLAGGLSAAASGLSRAATVATNAVVGTPVMHFQRQGTTVRKRLITLLPA